MENTKKKCGDLQSIVDGQDYRYQQVVSGNGGCLCADTYLGVPDQRYSDGQLPLLTPTQVLGEGVLLILQAHVFNGLINLEVGYTCSN